MKFFILRCRDIFVFFLNLFCLFFSRKIKKLSNLKIAKNYFGNLELYLKKIVLMILLRLYKQKKIILNKKNFFFANYIQNKKINNGN